jgi:hypothetical protein
MIIKNINIEILFTFLSPYALAKRNKKCKPHLSSCNPVIYRGEQAMPTKHICHPDKHHI